MLHQWTVYGVIIRRSFRIHSIIHSFNRSLVRSFILSFLPSLFIRWFGRSFDRSFSSVTQTLSQSGYPVDSFCRSFGRSAVRSIVGFSARSARHTTGAFIPYKNEPRIDYTSHDLHKMRTEPFIQVRLT